MIRRTKDSVEFELGAKSRETIMLDSGKIWDAKDDSMKETIENCKEFTADVEKLSGNDRKEVLLRLYAESAKLKSNAVCSYVKELVKEKKKFIIFGYHMAMLDAISNCLKQLNVSYIRIDGTTKSELRATYIDRFQNKKSCQVAVLSLKACNAAITLTAASLVIFAELDWNPSTLAQCESRAQRIGQKSPVICRYLLGKGTIDDYMWNMVKGKQDVLSKAGIFSEDLSDATHSTVSISNQNNKVTSYFKKDEEAGPSNIDYNQLECEKNEFKNQMAERKDCKEYEHLLDDDDDMMGICSGVLAGATISNMHNEVSTNSKTEEGNSIDVDSSNNNSIKQICQSNQPNQLMAGEDDSMIYKQMLDGDDDDFAMLDY